MAQSMESRWTWQTVAAFLLGRDLLIAQSPFPDEVDDYTVGLPPVGWYDYWSGARVDASTGRKAIDNTAVVQPEVRIHRTLDTLPVFVRAGAIVPEQPLVQSTDEKPQGPLTLRVYPPTAIGNDCEGSVYLDDGVSYDFKQGQFLREKFSLPFECPGSGCDCSRARGQLCSVVEAAYRWRCTARANRLPVRLYRRSMGPGQEL